MTFLLPSILAGLFALVIPIIIHLLFRRRSRKIRWAAFQFLAQPASPTLRRRNLLQYLLMAIRIAIIAFVALALARPQVATHALPQSWLPDSPISIAIVIDHSLSAQRPSAGQFAFDRAIDVTDEILRQLRPTDTACIILAEHEPRLLSSPITGRNQSAIRALQSMLHAQQPGLTDASIPGSIALARSTLDAGPRVEKIVLVISPESQSNWQPHDPIVWQSILGTPSSKQPDPITVTTFPIPPDPTFDDTAVGDITIEPTIVGAARPVHIQCTVTNRGTQQVAAQTIRLTIDGTEIDNAPIPLLLPKASTPITFDISHGFPTPGSHRITISLNARDSFPADDTAIASIDVLDKIPVLIVNGTFSPAGSDQSSQFLLAAIHPNNLSILIPTQVSLAEVSTIHLGDFAVVVLNDCPTLPREFRDDLVDYTRAGHGLWCILGPRTQPDFLESHFATTGLFRGKLKSIQSAPTPMGNRAIINDKSHPSVSIISRDTANPLAGSHVQTWWSLESTDATAQTIIATPSGEPLALERPFGSNGGNVLLWTTSVTTNWNNWPLMPNFVPLVEETLQHLSAGHLKIHPLAFSPGQPIEWAAPSDRTIDSVLITRPDGSTLQKPVILNDGRYLATFANTFQPGFYSVQPINASTPPRTYAVNINSARLSDTPLDPDDIHSLVQNRALSAALPTIAQNQLPQLLRPHTDHLNLTTPLLIALLAALVAESALAYFIMRASQTAILRSQSNGPQVPATTPKPGGVAA